MAYYTIDELAEMVGLTIQTLYKRRREDEELSRLMDEDSRKRGRRILYGEAVAEWLTDYYRPLPPTTNLTVEAEPSEAETPASTFKWQEEVARLTAENAKLTERIDELHKQNGLLLLLLQEEKQEKQALLPAPKVGLWQRLFGRKEDE